MKIFHLARVAAFEPFRQTRKFRPFVNPRDAAQIKAFAPRALDDPLRSHDWICELSGGIHAAIIARLSAFIPRAAFFPRICFVGACGLCILTVRALTSFMRLRAATQWQNVRDQLFLRFSMAGDFVPKPKATRSRLRASRITIDYCAYFPTR